MNDFLFFTICSLRYDVAMRAMEAGDTPNFQRLFGGWEKRECAATFTLPSHVAMFSGRTPRPPAKELPDGHDRAERMFALSTKWERYKGRNIRYFFEDSPNVPRGFASWGYHTIGVGGVGWFNPDYASSNLWLGNYFQRFLFKDEYGAAHPEGFSLQIQDLERELQSVNLPRFIFINASACHVPYIHGKEGDDLPTAQSRSLSYIDSQLPRLLNLLSSTFSAIITADHGDCQGEEGLYGHGFVHENILTVPYAEVER